MFAVTWMCITVRREGRPPAVNTMTAEIGSSVVRQHFPEYAGSKLLRPYPCRGDGEAEPAVAQATTLAAEFAPRCASTATTTIRLLRHGPTPITRHDRTKDELMPRKIGEGLQRRPSGR